MKIKAKVELYKVEQWYIDWSNESEKAKELKKLESDIKMAIYERCGVDLPNISIELEVEDSPPISNPHHCPECSWQCYCSSQPCSCCS